MAKVTAELAKDIEAAKKKEWDKAISLFQKAVRADPGEANNHNNLGLALLASGKPEESVTEFQTALRLKPGLTGAADNLRRAQAQSGSGK